MDKTLNLIIEDACHLIDVEKSVTAEPLKGALRELVKNLGIVKKVIDEDGEENGIQKMREFFELYDVIPRVDDSGQGHHHK